jgi:hypothetical protein
MPIYEMTADKLNRLPVTRYEDNDIKERGDLQRLLRDNIEVVSPDTLIIAEEFGEWDKSKRRIDLLGVDKQGNLVVIELKRTEDGGHMDLQAIRYASMVANMLVSEAVGIYGKYLKSKGLDQDAKSSLYEFLEWENEADEEEETFANDVRIVLVSAEFSKELTTSVLWLNSRKLDIRCVKMAPYKDGNRILVDVQEVIPLPEAADYQTRIDLKEQAGRKLKAEQHGLRKLFWTGLLNLAGSKTGLHARISPGDASFIAASSGIRGLNFNYNIAKTRNFVELYIDRGAGSIKENKEIFDNLVSHKADIEKWFGGPLEWLRLDSKQACRICANNDGGYRSNEEDWRVVQNRMVDSMILLEKAIRPYLDKLKV